METNYTSRFEIGEAVFLSIHGESEIYRIPCHIRTITFTNMKVRYSLFLDGPESTLHNVDSILVAPRESNKLMNFGDDNYS